jgi:hypothetical protein
MPAYWTPKQERQYSHIKQSCIQRKCRTVRGKKQCVRTCTRMAAATTNKFRSQGLGALRIVERNGIYHVVDDADRVRSTSVERWMAEASKEGLEEYEARNPAPPPKFKPQRRRKGTQGLGNVRGKCCVVRGKKRIACFHSRKDALALKRSLKKTSGLKIRCV